MDFGLNTNAGDMDESIIFHIIMYAHNHGYVYAHARNVPVNNIHVVANTYTVSNMCISER